MNIVLTGSIGNIGKPLTKLLVEKGHTVTVISSQPSRQAEIETLGATAAIGSMEDPASLTTAFKGADIVYLMETLAPGSFFKPDIDVYGDIKKIAENYKQAVLVSGVKKIVHLSSVGAHSDQGTGIIRLHYYAEQILNSLPADVSIKFMRPAGFYYVTLALIPLIKATGSIISNYGGDDKEPWVSPDDIAAVISEEMDAPFDGRKVRYIASEELSPNEVATILGTSIGKPDLKWTVVSDEQRLNALLGAGMNPTVAEGFVETYKNVREGSFYKDYFQHRPDFGKVKLKDYAKVFAAAYNK
jgi:uncharacterized protein YbjT (DUF2867 family)